MFCQFAAIKIILNDLYFVASLPIL